MNMQPRLTERSQDLGETGAALRFGLPLLEQYLEAEEAAPFVHMSPRHLKKLAREGKVPAHPRGDGQRRRWLFLLSALGRLAHFPPDLCLTAEGQWRRREVVQELCRHASPQTTLQLYVQAFSEDARRAQGKVVEIVRKALKPETLTASAHNKPLNVPYCASTEGEISA